MVDNYITQENVDAYFKYEFLPNKIESQLTNFIVYDLETYNSDRTKPYNISFYRLSKIAAKYNRVLIQDDFDRVRRDTLVFDGESCISNVLDYMLELRDERKVANKIVEYN